MNLPRIPIKIAKTLCGKLVKVYDGSTDWQTFTTGSVKYPELWKSKYSGSTAIDAINRSIEINGLTFLEWIK